MVVDINYNRRQSCNKSYFSLFIYIYIGHDNSGRGAGWYLDRVVLHSLNSGLEQTFDCKEWIEQTKDASSYKKLTENKSKRREIKVCIKFGRAKNLKTLIKK